MWSLNSLYTILIDLNLNELFQIWGFKKKNPHPRTYLLILEREEGRERETERNIDSREKHWSDTFWSCLTGDWTCNLGVCPNQELNLGPLGLQNNTAT